MVAAEFEVHELDTIHRMEENRYAHSLEVIGDAISAYGVSLEAYTNLQRAIDADGVIEINGKVVEDQYRPLYVLLTAVRYDYTMAILQLFRGHVCDAYYHVRSALDYAGVMRLMREKPELEQLWIDAETDEGKFKAYKDQTRSAAMLPKVEDPDPSIDIDKAITTDLNKRYSQTSERIHNSIKSMPGRIKTVAADAVRFEYFDVDKKKPETLFEPYLWIVESHLIILSMFDTVFEPELKNHRIMWEHDRAAATINLQAGYKVLLGEDRQYVPTE